MQGPNATNPHQDALAKALRPIKDGPRLFEINGVGTVMLGYYVDRQLLPRFYSVLWFIFFFVPLFPLGIYLISDGPDRNAGPGKYEFHAEIDLADFSKIYPDGVFRLFVTALGRVALVFGFFFVLFVIASQIFFMFVRP